MFSLMVAIELIISILLIIVILMQSSKGGGLAGSFGTGGMGTVFGVRRTADFLTRSTRYLAIAFLGVALFTNWFFLPGKQAAADSIIQRNSAPTSAPKAVPPPASKPAAAPQQKQ
ncbi:MAG TPA: preprotein translocase subunit SecG [Bacteroidota bacterium]|jgi:preprotein translocase subunit SecG|nr:preprotein translocase subunit SecG [Bacteroidota bacterium]